MGAAEAVQSACTNKVMPNKNNALVGIYSNYCIFYFIM